LKQKNDNKQVLRTPLTSSITRFNARKLKNKMRERLTFISVLFPQTDVMWVAQCWQMKYTWECDELFVRMLKHDDVCLFVC